MSWSRRALALTLLVCSIAPPTSEATSNSGPIELTSESTINPEVKYFVKFFAPWCGACQKLAPVWDQLPQKVGKEVTIASVDCTKEEAMCDLFHVEAYPTMVYLHKGEMDEYDGAFTVDAMANFALGEHKDMNFMPQMEDLEEEPQDKATSNATMVTRHNMDILNRAGKTIFLRFYSRQCAHCKDMAKTWLDLESELSGNSQVEFAASDVGMDTVPAGKFEIQGLPSMMVIKEGKYFPYPTTKPRTVKALKDFIANTGTVTGLLLPTFHHPMVESLLEEVKRLRDEVLYVYEESPTVVALLLLAGSIMGSMAILLMVCLFPVRVSPAVHSSTAKDTKKTQ